jgi:polyhydroxybutyrate depolymerase
MIMRATATAALLFVLFVTGACFNQEARADLRGTKPYSISSGGLTRTFLVHAPPSYDGSKAMPLVVSFHGAWGTGAKQEEITGWSKLADQNGFLVAYPDGTSRAWNAGDQCCDPPRKQGVNDLGFARDLVGFVKKTYKVDDARVYGNGFSNGAMLIHYIACAEPDLFTAVAVNAGALMTSTCKPTRPLPFLIIQGKKDPRMPWGGGTYDGTYRLPVVDLVKRIATRNHCSSTTDTVSYRGGPAECRTVSGCGANEVTYCGVEGVGHQWIGGLTVVPMLLGGNTDKFNATFAMWRFFARHPDTGK